MNKNKLSTVLFYFSIILFIIAFNFAHNPPSGWYQQFLPFLNNRPLSDVTFLDSLTGYGITGNQSGGDTNYVIKTTNGGDNWFIINTIYRDLSRVRFINQNTGFVCGGFNAVGGIVIKTTNGGDNWFSLNASFANHFDDMFAPNEDTIWLTDDNGFNGGVFRTINGGANWILQYNSASFPPTRIYMINSEFGFYSYHTSRLFGTTDGGFNWIDIPGENGFIEMYFIDSLKGWKTIGDTMKFTTNGGINWMKQSIPSGGLISENVMSSFMNINKDTLWGCGGWVHYLGNEYRGILYRTTNQGMNWFYQIPDTSIHIASYEYINFFTKKYGWAYANYPNYITGIHAKTGGDTIFLNVKKLSNEIPLLFSLSQNYPNPFNPVTVINYQLIVSSYVKLKVFDISGKEIEELVNGKQNSGTYEVKFNGNSISSGVYFYRIEAKDVKGNVFFGTKKMILLR